MQFHLTPEQLAWQQEVRNFLKEVVTPELLKEVEEHEDKAAGPLEREYYKRIAEKGWKAMNWSKEYGGLERTAVEQFIFNEEFMYAKAPYPLGGEVSITAPSIMKYGTEENKKIWLPKIMEGEVTTALSYSEPNAGTDLASLQTSAVQDGDEWVINGQKTWNTIGHRVSHQWAAVRTDPSAPKHKGISIIIIPNDAPGVTLVKQHTWGNHTTNEVFFDNVRVPKENLIGNVNQGWMILTGALDHERIVMGSSGQIRRIFDDLVKHCRHTVVDGELLINRPDVRSKLAELYTDLEVARLFGFRGASMIDQGKDCSSEASMMKVYATELRTKIADFGMQIVGMYGQLNKHDELAPLLGALEHQYRLAPFHRFGGGTNEVQRNIVAQRGLRLPRR
ncbi:acyl-CoA dehydrogenase family protein [Neobacillus sp. 179-C4.2 HS]|uniref:Acyl-CoA dehydrogenase family protein n=1 Tax=Neobacillus driksii TaxID=3035913 RepID=A0ABV4YUL4_9BACI|nr:acyl-CoA dehydrogenase family protein [Neobacillus sp. 179.-C4.2 HS]MDP5192688.1 acyl-CoA dehydrogenase family protein [Neobacillus sp. 179.-C4.2 HS]